MIWYNPDCKVDFVFHLDKEMINLRAYHIIMHHELYEEEDCRNYVLLVAMIVMTVNSIILDAYLTM